MAPKRIPTHLLQSGNFVPKTVKVRSGKRWQKTSDIRYIYINPNLCLSMPYTCSICHRSSDDGFRVQFWRGDDGEVLCNACYEDRHLPKASEVKSVRAVGETKVVVKEESPFFGSVSRGAGLCIGVCVGIVILVFVFGFLVGLGKQAEVPKEAPSNETAPPAATAVPQRGPVTTAAAPAEREFELPGLSRNVEINGVKVSVLNAYKIPGDKTKYYFEISSENASAEDVWTPSNSSFQVENQEQFVTNSTVSFGLDDSYPYFQKLSRNQKVKGYVFFELKKEETPAALVLKEWSLFGSDRLIRWKIQNSDIKQVECIAQYDCQTAIYQECKQMKCAWSPRHCGVASDCGAGEQCTSNTCFNFG